jgi:hypothetical protein
MEEQRGLPAFFLFNETRVNFLLDFAVDFSPVNTDKGNEENP